MSNNKKLMSLKTALILELIFVILIAYAVYYFFDKKYQKAYEEFPTLSVVQGDKKIGEFIPIDYDWIYKGETKNYSLPEVTDEYKTTENNIILCDYNMESDVKVKSNVRYKTRSYSAISKNVKHLGEKVVLQEDCYGSGEADISKSLINGEWDLITSSTGEGCAERVYTFKMNYFNQGNVTYSARVVTFDKRIALLAKPYLNTSIEDKEKVKELVGKIRYGQFLKGVEFVDGNNLTLTYEYWVDKNQTKLNNLVLFACIPELETISYTAINKKTQILNEETGEVVFDELDKITFTREEVDNESLANIENLKKYMNQI